MSRMQEMVRIAASSVGRAEDQGDGVWRVTAGDESVTVICGEEDENLVAVADVGDPFAASEPDLLLEDALKANLFWKGTGGATLSVNPETGRLTLADRREADGFGDAAALAAHLEDFMATAHRWRRYVADCTPAASPTEPVASASDADWEVGVEIERRFVRVGHEPRIGL